MTGDVATLVAIPTLGVTLVVMGWWSLRHIEQLVGTQGGEDVVDRRRATMTRGARAIVVTGLCLAVGGLVLLLTRCPAAAPIGWPRG